MPRDDMGLIQKLPPSKLDVYLLRQMLPRMGGVLLIALAALLIERILRLFDLVAGFGAEIGLVLSLAINLIPHYIGLALPAALCFATLATLSALSQSNEIDVLEGAGWSLRRIGVPFIALSVVMVFISLLLFGIVQPYSRYAFHEIRYQIQTAGWKGRVEQTAFFDLGEGMTLSVGDVDPGNRLFYRVFLLRNDDDGETVTTARRGSLAAAEDGNGFYLLLEDGQILFPKGQTLTFDKFPIARRFDLKDIPFRDRGDNHRELTFTELWDRMHPADGSVADPRFTTEFHNRLIRAVSLIAVALMAVPLGITRKRVPTWRRAVIAIGILAAYDNIIKFVAGLGTLGRIDPALGLWSLCGLFIAGGFWLYMTTASQGSNSPFSRLIVAINDIMLHVGQRLTAIMSKAKHSP